MLVSIGKLAVCLILGLCWRDAQLPFGTKTTARKQDRRRGGGGGGAGAWVVVVVMMVVVEVVVVVVVVVKRRIFKRLCILYVFPRRQRFTTAVRSLTLAEPSTLGLGFWVRATDKTLSLLLRRS